jgi:acylphosphatase
MQKIKLIVSGRVQGVGFRYTTLQAATKFHIKGKVWNNDDGTVGILAQSDDAQALTAFEQLIRDGFGVKPWIKVRYVDVTTDHSPDCTDFQITD